MSADRADPSMAVAVSAAIQPRRGVWRRAWPGLCILLVVVLGCVVTLPWTVASFNLTRLDAARRPPDLSHWMGTDLLGRSLAARTLLGGAVSLCVGGVAACMSIVVGVTWGLVAAWSGGRVEALMMRIVDVLYGLPYILLVILIRVGVDDILVHRLGWQAGASNFVVLLISISAVSWLTMARVIRGEVLSLKQRPFIDAARVMGLPTWRIALTHLLPNLLGTIVVYATLTVPQAILQESFLSFLGIGIERPMPSWGNLAADGVSAVNNVESFWWMLLFPCGMLTATLLALNGLGEALREALDPRGRR